MKKILYFICPTDGLESIINTVFPHENYYYTSLGNSVTFNQEVLKQTEKLIHRRKIEEITFVLADDNRIMLDAVGQRNHLDITGLGRFYHQVSLQKEKAKLSWQTQDTPLLLPSYYLNEKITEFQHGLEDTLRDKLQVNGKIYRRRTRIFSEVYPDFVCLEGVNMN